jgi:hypothetical protein
MLLLAHLSREPVPAALQKDLNFVLTKSLGLLQEMFAIALVPRTHNQVGLRFPRFLAMALSPAFNTTRWDCFCPLSLF